MIVVLLGLLSVLVLSLVVILCSRRSKPVGVAPVIVLASDQEHEIVPMAGIVPAAVKGPARSSVTVVPY